MQDYDPTWHTRLLALIMFGMVSGLYHDFTEVPLWKIQGDPAAPPLAGDDTDEEADREAHDQAEKVVAYTYIQRSLSIYPCGHR